MQQIDYRITTEFIELNQLLKICGLAASGGAGGALVTEGNVQWDPLESTCRHASLSIL